MRQEKEMVGSCGGSETFGFVIHATQASKAVGGGTLVGRGQPHAGQPPVSCGSSGGRLGRDLLRVSLNFKIN